MANEIRTAWPTGSTLYGIVFRPSDGKVWYPTGVAFETWGTSSRTAADYKVITFSETSGSGYYYGDFPTAITTANLYDVQIRVQAGAAAADTDDIIGIDPYRWTGVAIAGAGAALTALTLSELITEVQELCGHTGDTTLITQGRVTNFLNWAQTRILRTCPGHIDLETNDADALTLVDATFEYSFSSLSPAVFYPLRLYYMDGTASKKLKYKDPEWFDLNYPSPTDQADGIPNVWTRRKSQVDIYPVPTSAEAGKYLRLDYTAVFTSFSTSSLSASSDMADVDEGLINFAVGEAFSAIGNKDTDAAKYFALFDNWLEGYRMDKDSLFMSGLNCLFD